MEVNVTSSFNTVVTIDEIQRYVDYQDSNEQDIDMLLRMAKSAQELCEQYTDHYFSVRTAVFYFEKLIDFNSDDRTIRFPYSPVNSVSEVLAISSENAETELTDGTTYYLRGLKRKELYLPESFTTGSSSETIAWKVTASVGFSSAPSIIKECILKLVYEWYNVKGNYIPILNDQVKNILQSYGDKGWL